MENPTFEKIFSMYQITINNTIYDVTPETGDTHQGTVNDSSYQFEMQPKDAHNWVVEKDGKVYNVEVVSLDVDTKLATLRINGRKYKTQMKDEFDKLLKDLGLEGLTVKKEVNIKSPMPGLVLDVMVQPGDTIKKGDQVLVLEAMKMENIIKSQADAVVKSVKIDTGVAVEKNQVLIEFE